MTIVNNPRLVSLPSAKRNLHPRRSVIGRNDHRRLRLERLEDRLALATSAFYSMPTNLTGTQGGSVTVPVTIDHLFDANGNQGLSSAVAVLTYDPTVFSVSNADVTQGALLTNPPPSGSWTFVPNAATPGEIDINVGSSSLSNDITSDTGGVLANIDFHVLAAAATGSSTIHVVVSPEVSPNGQSGSAIPDSGPNSVQGDSTGYTLDAADQVNGVVQIAAQTVTHFSITAPATTTAGAPFSITVAALDAGNSVVTGYTGTVHFTKTDSGTGSAVPADYTFVAGDLGEHAFTNGVTFVTAGNQTITATDTANASITGNATVSVNAAAATHLGVTAPATATAGAPFNFIVTAQDQFNNTDTGYTGTVHFTSTDGQAVLPANSQLANGAGSFSATLETAGNQTITATDTQTPSITGTSNAIAVVAAAATHFTVTAPATVNAGALFSFTVTAQDQFNNTATGYGGTVHFTSTDGAPALPNDSTLSNGTGTFTARLNTPGNQTITATDTLSSSITGTSNSILVSAAATHFSVTANPNATAGTPFSISVTALDASNSVVTGYTGTVHFTKSDGGSGSVVPADYTFVAGDNGVHAFLNGVTFVTAGNQTITATDTVTPSITGSATVAVSAAAATHYTVSAPSTATPGSAFNFTVTAQDQFNNTATGYTGTVHFTSTDGAAVLPANSTLSNGTSSFSATLQTAGSQTITATDTASSSITGTSNTITVGQLDSTTSLTSNTNPVDYGLPYTFTATVTPTTAGPTPTGDVTFVDTTTGTTLGVRTLNGSGIATLTVNGTTVAFLDAGLHTVKATYAGDTDYKTSSGTFTETVNQVSTSTTVVTDHPSGSVFGEPVTYTATVTSPTTTPFGSVTFSADDGQGHVTPMGTKSLNSNGVAALTFNDLPVGTFTVTAAFTANVDFKASSGTTSETVSQGTASSSLSTSKSPSAVGEAVTFTFTVTANAPSTLPPTGSATFTDTTTSTTLGTVSLVTGSGGQSTAMLTVSSLSGFPGGTTHTIVATYNTDGNYATTSATVDQTVIGAATDVSVSKTGPGSVAPGDDLTYTIIVNNIGTADAQTVALTDLVPGDTTFVSATQTAGPSFTLTRPPVGGTGAFTATVSTFATGASAVFSLVVNVNSSAAVGGQILNSASVTTATSDSNPNNNSSSTSADIEQGQTGGGLPECDITTANAAGAVGTAVLVDDADNSGTNMLLVTGTSRSDVIVIEPRPSNAAQIRVRINGQLAGIFTASNVQRIVAFGLSGNDTIIVSAALSQSATLFGDAGNDSLFAGSGNDQLEGGSGNDHLFGGAGDDALCGDDGNDFLYGGQGSDTLFGEAGNDRLFGESGNDLLLGGGGNDFLYGGNGNDQLYGQSGSDQLFGEAGNNILVGGDGNDKLYGGPGRDLLIGGNGADQLFGGGGDDILVAGSTSFDEDPDSLQAIMAEWSSSNSYSTRVNNLRFGGGANGAVTLDSTTIVDDGAADALWGQAGQDWFLTGIHTKLKDRLRNELVN
jgi:uncharacterized repeat protein (TIGR01451 family)